MDQDEINRLSSLDTLLKRISYLTDNIKMLQDTKLQLVKEYEPVLTEYNSIEVCPYCGNKLHDGKEVTDNE